ncbi:hypothetical protein AMS68_000083 [Peltaster fructicola]|uniref:Stress response protein ish1 n=1 Tax=Peltaster fructicola TaxID=286661 RepID=A0A6H0XIL9_9PEZI|nr:hypothetical protein AMS68_000083 [Peltaster fructicola]
MKFSLASAAVVALATQSVVANSWFGTAGRVAYNKWHETELERWLSDHDIPYPTPSDRKNLQDLVQKNWEDNIVKPYNRWDTNQLQSYITSKGKQVQKGTEKNTQSLISQVAGVWTETTEQANDAWGKVENWLFDTWTESQLKSFLDYHDIPNPSPRTRDSLLHTARANYQKAATKTGQTFAYPGDWVWQQWSDSEVKAWLDERGIPVPQGGARDKLVASLRRNSKLAADSAKSSLASASKSAASAQATLSDQLLNAWSDSEIKAWFDKNGIPVPQGSKRNEMIALARKHSNRMGSSASSVYGAATSSAGNAYAQATTGAYAQVRGLYDYVLNNFGLASAEAKASLSSASSVASKSLSSASSVASVEASKSGKVASSSLSSGSSVGNKSASSAASVASKSASSAASVAMLPTASSRSFKRALTTKRTSGRYAV